MTAPVDVPDELLRTLSGDGCLAVRVLTATRLVSVAATRHGTSPTASAALGRSLMGAVLLAAGTQDDETVQVQLRGDGELGQVLAIADGGGSVRGYVHNPAAHPPPRDGKLDVGRAVGQGILAIVRYRPSWRDPYSGIVPIVSGEIGEDLAHYLAESEQVPSALAVGVFVGASGEIEAAGGYLVQALPGASPELLADLEDTIRELPTPTEMLRAGLTADDVLARLLSRTGRGEVERIEPRFSCSCNRDRIRQAVVLLGRAETREIAQSGEELEVRCEFCATSYRLGPDEVGALFPDA